jgi:hypothetical protein
MVAGTALKSADTVLTIVVEPATEILEFVAEVGANTTISIEDPTGKNLASATIKDGGAVAVQALPNGAGTYALVIHNASAGDAAFTAWEVVTEQR